MRPYVGSVKMIEPSEATITSFGLFSSLSPQCVASVSRVPSGRSRTTELVTCSQTIRLPSLSSVMPLHLLLGSRSTDTPSSGCQRRRLSPGMSLKWSEPSDIQIGPSVNVKPVAICSTCAPSSISASSLSECTATAMRPPWETSAEPKAPRRSRQGRVIDLEEVRDLGQPARLDEAHVIGVLVVRRVRGLIGELHRDAEPVRVLRARLAQDLERLDTGNCRELGSGAQEVGLLRRSLGVRWREDDRVPDAAPAECAA